jgi:hypothetical protein
MAKEAISLIDAYEMKHPTGAKASTQVCTFAVLYVE